MPLYCKSEGLHSRRGAAAMIRCPLCMEWFQIICVGEDAKIMWVFGHVNDVYGSVATFATPQSWRTWFINMLHPVSVCISLLYGKVNV